MNKTFAVLAVSAFALMGCDSGTANAQNPSAMPAMSAECSNSMTTCKKKSNKSEISTPKSWTNTKP